jgi:hypothetical protein
VKAQASGGLGIFMTRNFGLEGLRLLKYAAI